MIPVRIASDFTPATHGEPLVLVQDHPLISDRVRCPACDGLFDTTRAVVLVPVGIAPHRRQGRFSTGGAVAVHGECARPLTATEAADELARLGQQFDIPSPPKD